MRTKAATNAIGLITMIPEHTEIVTELLAIAQEEMETISIKFTKSSKRGYILGRTRKDDYVNQLLNSLFKEVEKI